MAPLPLPKPPLASAERTGARPRFIRLTPESGELLHLDALRLLASIAIVVVHFRTNLLAAWPSSSEAFRRLDGLSVGVDLFFAISGFVICWVYHDRMTSLTEWANFMRRRVARLVPLHWATLLFFVAVGIAAGVTDTALSKPSKYGFDCLLPNALLIHAFGVCSAPSFNTVSWSISAEMAMYVSFPLLLVILRRTPFGFLAGLFCLIAFLETSPWSPPWIERTYAGGVIRAVPGFCLGMVLFQFNGQLARIPAARVLLAASLAGFVLAVGLGAPKGALVLIAYLTAALGVAADRGGQAGPIVRAIAPGGRLTYSIYMLHPIVQSLFISLLGRRILQLNPWQTTLWSIVGIFFAIAVGYLSLCMLEEPARRILSRPCKGNAGKTE